MTNFFKWPLTILCIIMAAYLPVFLAGGMFGLPGCTFSLMLEYHPIMLLLALVGIVLVVILLIKNRSDIDLFEINFHTTPWVKPVVLLLSVVFYVISWDIWIEDDIEKKAATKVSQSAPDTTSVQKQILATDTVKSTSSSDQKAKNIILLDQNDSSGVIYQALIESMRRKKDSLVQAIATEKRAIDVVKEKNRKKLEQKNYFCQISKEEKKQIDSLAASLLNVKREKSKIAIIQTADCDCPSEVVVVVNGKKQ